MNKDNPVQDWTCEKSGSVPGIFYYVEILFAMCINKNKARVDGSGTFFLTEGIRSAKLES